MTKKPVSPEQFAQTAAELKKGVAGAVNEGMAKLRAKHLADNPAAVRMIALIPGLIASAIESREPEPGTTLVLSVLQGGWDDPYCEGQMPYDEYTSVVMAYCRAADLQPKRLESESGCEILISVKIEEKQPAA